MTDDEFEAIKARDEADREHVNGSGESSWARQCYSDRWALLEEVERLRGLVGVKQCFSCGGLEGDSYVHIGPSGRCYRCANRIRRGEKITRIR